MEVVQTKIIRGPDNDYGQSEVITCVCGHNTASFLWRRFAFSYVNGVFLSASTGNVLTEFSHSPNNISKLVPYEQADVASSVENDSWSSN
jgi:hypothetical protein